MVRALCYDARGCYYPKTSRERGRDAEEDKKIHNLWGKPRRLLTLMSILGSVVSGTVYSDPREVIRESTIVYKLKEDATPAQLKRFNALINRRTVLSGKEIAGV
jgi:hypothetical protein